MWRSITPVGVWIVAVTLSGCIIVPSGSRRHVEHRTVVMAPAPAPAPVVVNPAPPVVVRPPVQAVPPAPFVIAVRPRLVFMEEYGVSFAPELEFDVYETAGVWYASRSGRWYKADAYDGPWSAIRRRELPRHLMKVAPGQVRKAYLENGREPKHKRKAPRDGDRRRRFASIPETVTPVPEHVVPVPEAVTPAPEPAAPIRKTVKAVPPVSASMRTPTRIPAPAQPDPAPVPFVLSENPRLVFMDEFGLSFAPDLEFDVYKVGGAWYAYRGKTWYQADRYDGPWSLITSRQLPPRLAKVAPGQVRKVYVAKTEENGSRRNKQKLGIPNKR